MDAAPRTGTAACEENGNNSAPEVKQYAPPGRLPPTHRGSLLWRPSLNAYNPSAVNGRGQYKFSPVATPGAEKSRRRARLAQFSRRCYRNMAAYDPIPRCFYYKQRSCRWYWLALSPHDETHRWGLLAQYASSCSINADGRASRELNLAHSRRACVKIPQNDPSEFVDRLASVLPLVPPRASAPCHITPYPALSREWRRTTSSSRRLCGKP